MHLACDTAPTSPYTNHGEGTPRLLIIFSSEYFADLQRTPSSHYLLYVVRSRSFVAVASQSTFNARRHDTRTAASHASAHFHALVQPFGRDALRSGVFFGAVTCPDGWTRGIDSPLLVIAAPNEQIASLGFRAVRLVHGRAPQQAKPSIVTLPIAHTLWPWHAGRWPHGGVCV